MWSIYRGAARVTVWLDPTSLMMTTTASRGDDSETRARRLSALMRRFSIRGKELRPETREEAAGLLVDHLAMPWFRRRWIIQEVVGNPDVVLLCGAEETGWLPLMLMVVDVFREDVHAVRTPPPAVVRSVLMMSDLWRMWVLGDDERTSGRCGLATLLDRFGRFGCADGRDRIYVISGLAEDCHGGDDAAFSINPDYDTTDEELYIKVAQALIDAGYLPWVLSQACARRGLGGVGKGMATDRVAFMFGASSGLDD